MITGRKRAPLGGSRPKRKSWRRGRRQALRQSLCFRVFLGMTALQVLILIAVSVLLDPSPNAADSSLSGRGRRSLQAVRDYLPTLRQNHDTEVGSDVDTELPKGFVVDDDYQSTTDTQAQSQDHPNDDVYQLEDHLANQTEHQLNQPKLTDESSKEQEPIDNYFQRKQQRKVPPPRDEPDPIYGGGEPPFNFLVVGGSDGSGTRSVVSALAKLGVPMLIEDKKTLDIHGGCMLSHKGWPPIVEMVLNYTHSANYEISDLPPLIQEIAEGELTKLQEHLNHRGERNIHRQLRKLQRQGRVNHYNPHDGKHKARTGIPGRYVHVGNGNRRLMGDHPPESFKFFRHAQMDDEVPVPPMGALNHSRAVKYGWKAPVSMLLLPFLRKVFGPIKFIHVVRDGRDVCLSENQSPVKKFYNTYYDKGEKFGDDEDKDSSPRIPKNDTAMNIRAMELWNDWNLQVLEYEKKHAGADDFDYMILRTEDLLSPLTKFQTLQQLADFVGSPLTVQDVCCQSLQAVVDMGESVAISGKNGPKNVRVKVTHGGFDSSEFLKKFQENLDAHSSWLHAFDKGPREFKTSDLGKDPVLSYIQNGKNDDELDENDKEYRHSGWHHGLFDADAIKENAKKTRMEYLQNRNLRFKNLGDRVSNRRYSAKHLEGQPILEKAAAERASHVHRRLLGSFHKLQLRASHYRPRKTKPVPLQKNEGGGGEFGNYREDRRQFKPHREKGQHFLRPMDREDYYNVESGQSQPWGFTSKLGQLFGFGGRQRPALDPVATRDTSQPKDQEPKSKTEVTARYGKWMNSLKDKPELSAAIHEIGKDALAAFGYEPQIPFMDISGLNHEFQCDSTVSCPDPELEQPGPKPLLY